MSRLSKRKYSAAILKGVRKRPTRGRAGKKRRLWTCCPRKVWACFWPEEDKAGWPHRNCRRKSDRVKRMKKDWTKIMNLVQGVKKMSDTYLEDYGELGAPPEIVVDPSLDD